MNRLSAAFVAGLFLAVFGSIATGATYYVSPTGSASNPGTQAAPWSLAKANSDLMPGDTAILMDGSYSTPIAPIHNGLAGQPITYAAQNSRQAILITSNPRIQVSYRSYIKIEGIKASNGNRWAIGNYASHITFNDCDFRHFGNGSFETGRFRDTGGYIHVTNSYFDDHADGIHIREGAGHYIANCTILKDEHSPLVLMGVNRSVVTNCYFSNPVHRCIEVLSTRLYMPPNEHRTDYIVIQDSYFFADDDKASAIKMNGNYSIVRRNVFDGCTNSGLRLPNAYGSQADYRPEGWFCEHNRVYNNTFYGNAESIQASKSNYVVSLGGAYGDNICVNNIIYGGSGAKQIDLYSDTHPSDVMFYYNSIMRTSPGQDVYYWNGYYTVAEMQAAFPAYNANNVEYNPQFVDAANDDFHLQPTSPCIDAGGPLTTTAGSGSGTVVTVNDALFFTDGYGLIDPDVIYVGPERVTIVSVDPAANQLTIDRSITWGAGVPVYLDYAGFGPDLGAFEYTGQSTNTQVVGRYVFYNNSAFDGNDPAANAADDDAIAPDKTALMPGGTATFANYTSYSRGINGIILDIANLAGTPTVSDFEFRVGNDWDPDNWPLAPAPSSITVRAGAGVGGSDRVTLIWPDNAMQKTWLRVTVKATANTGLSSPDVFYFGNAIGETGNSSSDAEVTAWDIINVRNDPHTLAVNPAEITNVCDFNRDRKVGPTDEVLVRNNATNTYTALQLISVP